jgi:hypothetical protein
MDLDENQYENLNKLIVMNIYIYVKICHKTFVHILLTWYVYLNLNIKYFVYGFL